MARSTYSGVRNGSVQTAYYDQMGTALSGDLAYTADLNLVDTAVVGSGFTGICAAGSAVKMVVDTGEARPGLPAMAITPYTVADKTATKVDGVMVRSQTLATDANGVSGWFAGDMGTFLSASRVGGRIWVKSYSAVTAGGTVCVIIADTTSHGQPIGTFTGAAITGDTFTATNATWLTACPAGGIALLELA